MKKIIYVICGFLILCGSIISTTSHPDILQITIGIGMIVSGLIIFWSYNYFIEQIDIKRRKRL